MKYHFKTESEQEERFASAVKQRVDEYFAAPAKNRYGGWPLIVKAALIVAAMAISYGLILFGQFGAAGTLACAIVLGLSSAMLVMNVGHDACHGMFSKNRLLNEVASHSWHVVGMSRYAWKLRHNIAHHGFPNVKGVDIDIELPWLMCLQRENTPSYLHRFQHWYAPLLYSIYTVYLIFVKDFQLLARRRFGNVEAPRIPWTEWCVIVLAKAGYLFYALVIPMLVLEFPWWQTLLGFCLMHVVASFFSAIVLSITHLSHGAHFVSPGPEGEIRRNWFVHQLQSVFDVSNNSRLVTWVTGGLNLHVAHHLFPKVSHVHYFELTRLIRDVAQSHGLEHRNKPLGRAVVDHFRFLKEAGGG